MRFPQVKNARPYKAQKKQHDAVAMNKGNDAICPDVQFSPTFEHIEREKRRDKAKASGKAHQVMSVIVKEFEPDDILAQMEMDHALVKLKLETKKDPHDLLNEVASIEAKENAGSGIGGDALL
jgi:hypothetical protein